VDESKPLDVGEDEPRQICSGLVPYMAAEVGLRGLHSFTLELNLSTFGTR
jgi:tRNA-binding EMAP/Myf-like protein